MTVIGCFVNGSDWHPIISELSPVSPAPWQLFWMFWVVSSSSLKTSQWVARTHTHTETQSICPRCVVLWRNVGASESRSVCVCVRESSDPQQSEFDGSGMWATDRAKTKAGTTATNGVRRWPLQNHHHHTAKHSSSCSSIWWH